MITNSIIKYVEQGYYNPSMKEKEPKYFKNMGDSGETFFGIDRKFAGKDMEAMPEWEKFWLLIDQDKKKNSKKWVYNYTLNDNPSLKTKLKDLTILMVKKRFQDLGGKFLTEKSKSVIQCSPYILYQLMYAAYNGYGFFQKLTTKINQLVNAGKSTDKIGEEINSWRSSYPNSIIKLSAPKIDASAKSLEDNIKYTNLPIF